jgi:hypothetical protein
MELPDRNLHDDDELDAVTVYRRVSSVMASQQVGRPCSARDTGRRSNAGLCGGVSQVMVDAVAEFMRSRAALEASYARSLHKLASALSVPGAWLVAWMHGTSAVARQSW